MNLPTEVHNTLRKYRFLTKLVGSRVTCNPVPETSDWDYLVYPEDPLFHMEDNLGKVVAFLDENGWSWEGDTEHYQTVAKNSFMSWRKDSVNLIVTTSGEFARRHNVATALCTRLNLMDKQDRIAVFQAVLYHNIWEK